MVPAASAIAALYAIFLEASNSASVYGRVTVSVTKYLVSVLQALSPPPFFPSGENLPAAHCGGSGHCQSYRQSVFVTLENKTSQLTVLRYASGWVRLTGKQSTMKDSGVDGFTYVL